MQKTARYTNPAAFGPILGLFCVFVYFPPEVLKATHLIDLSHLRITVTPRASYTTEFIFLQGLHPSAYMKRRQKTLPFWKRFLLD